MLRQTINAWQYLVGEPYKWVILTFFSPADAVENLPEKMTPRQYLLAALRVFVPYFTIAWLITVIAGPFVAAWNGYEPTSLFPWAKIALGVAVTELIALAAAAYWRTRLAFLLVIALGLPVSIGLAMGFAFL